MSEQRNSLKAQPQNTAVGILAIIWVILLLAGLVGVVILLVMVSSRSATQTAPLGLVIGSGVLVLVGAGGLIRSVTTLKRRIDVMQAERDEDLRAGEARSRSLYELAYQMGSTLNYEKILQAALEAGRLALRRSDDESANLVAVVMLFHSDDNVLHVVSGRRLTRADETVTIPGKNGIVGQGLREAEPIIGENSRDDAELQYFIAFQNCRSVLCIPLRTGFDNFGVILYGSEKANAFNAAHAELLSSIGIQATIALQNALLYQNIRDEKEKIIQAEEDARKKLSRDLHDGPTQTISAIAMRMGYINRLIQKSPEQVPAELQKVEELARRTTKEIRHLLFTLRPLVLETHGLAVALSQLAEKMKETHGQNVAVRVSREVENALDYNQQGIIFYIVEEGVNNARKHARAEIINVSVLPQGEYAVVQIADNGVGFNMNSVTSGYENRGSLGMINMRERAELIEGTLKVESREGRGTMITVYIPLRVGEGSRVTDAPKGTTKLALAASERMDRANLPRR
jgi:signal transduction histidine kinase